MKTIAANQIKAAIQAQNPWWDTGIVPSARTPGPERLYADRFYRLATDISTPESVILLGSRRVGKTAMLHHTIKRLILNGTSPNKIIYLPLDCALFCRLEPDRLWQAIDELPMTEQNDGPSFLFCDEIQYCADYGARLRRLRERHPGLRCVAAASALSAGDPATGFRRFILPPLTFYEFMQRQNRTLDLADPTRMNRDFTAYLNGGGFPEALPEDGDMTMAANPELTAALLRQDLPGRFGIADHRELTSLLVTLALNTGAELSIEQLTQTSGIAKNTLKKYLRYLEAAFLIRPVHRLDFGGERLIRATSFKVYLTNPSLRAALLGPIRPDDPDFPDLVATAVFAQLAHSDEPCFYARWNPSRHTSSELSLVSFEPDRAQPGYAMKITWSDRLDSDPAELEHAAAFCREHRLKLLETTTRTACGSRNANGVEIRYFPAAVACYVFGKATLKPREQP